MFHGILYGKHSTCNSNDAGGRVQTTRNALKQWRWQGRWAGMEECKLG